MSEALAKVEAAPMAPAVSEFVSVIERLASNPDVNVDKLEKIIDLQTRILDREAEQAFNQAFAAMQADIPVVVERGLADRGSNGGRYSYARFEDVMETIRPVLHRHGFGVSHKTEHLDGKVRVVGYLTHSAGHSRTSEFVAKADSGGGKNEVQALGSSTAYGRRYTTYDLLGLATRAQDDDGRATSEVPSPDGFDAWIADLEAVADEGMAAFSKSWNQSREDFRNFAAKHRLSELKSIKAKAQGVKRGA